MFFSKRTQKVSSLTSSQVEEVLKKAKLDERPCWVPQASHSHADMCPCDENAKLEKKLNIQARDHSRRDQLLPVQPQQARKPRNSPVAPASSPLKRAKTLQYHPQSLWERPGFQHNRPQSSCKRPVPLHLGLVNNFHDGHDSVQNTPVSSPTQPASVRQLRHPALLIACSNTSSLKRSPAQRGKSRQSTPHSVSYQDLSVTSLPQHIHRNTTWAPAAVIEQVNDLSDASLKEYVGTTQHQMVKGSTKGELMLKRVREKIHEELLASQSPARRSKIRSHSHEEGEMHAQADTYLLEQHMQGMSNMPSSTFLYSAVTCDLTQPVPRKRLVRIQTDMPSPTLRTAFNDLAMEVEDPTRVIVSDEIMETVAEPQVTEQSTEDDFREQYKFLAAHV